jgi:hypothetical protein
MLEKIVKMINFKNFMGGRLDLILLLKENWYWVILAFKIYYNEITRLIELKVNICDALCVKYVALGFFGTF